MLTIKENINDYDINDNIADVFKFSNYDYDQRIIILIYYFAKWSKDNNTTVEDKCNLNNIYFWLVNNPSIELVSKDYRCKLIIKYLNKFKSDDDDFMGAADLEDVKIELKKICKYFNLKNNKFSKECYIFLNNIQELINKNILKNIKFVEMFYDEDVYISLIVSKNIKNAHLFIENQFNVKVLPFINYTCNILNPDDFDNDWILLNDMLNKYRFCYELLIFVIM